MKLDDRFANTVVDWLHDSTVSSRPNYLEEVLTRTRRTRQRPSWSSVGRWLPVDAMTRPIALVGTAPALVVLALLVALTAAVLVVGSRPRLPAPFGEAGNGIIVYGNEGDLYAWDVEEGASVPIVTGLDEDETPDFSHDGSHFVFARRADVRDRWLLMVAEADGAGVRPLTAPILPSWNAWSPDDRHVLVVDAAPAIPELAIYPLGGGARVVVEIGGMQPMNVAFRPDGRELVFIGAKSGQYGIYSIETATGSALRTIVPPVSGSTTITGPTLSPDGQLLAYTRWDGDHSVVHLVDATGEDRAIELDAGSDGENVIAWSPDGSQLLFHRHSAGTVQLAVAPVTGGTARLVGPTFPEGVGAADASFSPDGRKVVARYPNDGAVWLLDLSGGPDRRVALETGAAVSWQRLAP